MNKPREFHNTTTQKVPLAARATLLDFWADEAKELMKKNRTIKLAAPNNRIQQEGHEHV